MKITITGNIPMILDSLSPMERASYLLQEFLSGNLIVSDLEDVKLEILTKEESVKI